MGTEKELLKEEEEGKFGLILTQRQKIWVSYFLPSALCCAVYIADVATDIALVERHYRDRQCLVAVLTLLIIYIPAVVYFVLTLSDLEQWPLDDDNLIKTKWVFKQLGLLVLFPVNALYRFAGCIFWSTEALLGPDTQAEESLAEVTRPSRAEFYLLLQAFFQAAPQAVFQTFILTLEDVPHERAGSVQVLSILTSAASIGIAAASYMRLESQRIAGRPIPWDVPRKNKPLETKESLMTTMESQITSDTIDNSPTENQPEEESDSPKPPPLPKGVPQSAILSLPPLPPQIRARLLKASGDDLPEDLQKHLDNDEESLNIRRSVYGSKSPIREPEDSFVLEPPEFPAPPRPLETSFDEDEPASNDGNNSNNEKDSSEPVTDHVQETEREQEDTNEETARQSPSEEQLSNEPLLDESTATITLEIKPTSPHKDFTTIPLPTRKRKVLGLEEDDFMSKATAFVWWFSLVLSRIITLGTLAHFSPWAFFALFFLHYICMLSYLFYCDKSKDPLDVLLKVSLGFVYVFCFIEIKSKFKNAIMFEIGYVFLYAVENIIMSLIWFYAFTWDSWWFSYSFNVIIISLVIGVLTMIFYFVFLKPKTVDIYQD